MSLRRRRLSSAGVACVAVWTAFAALSPPAPEALAQPTIDVRPALTSSGGSPTLVTFDMITLRPFVTLRQPGEPGVIIAHRGDSSTAPENTMPAIMSATSAGAKYFEIDLRMSQDGIPIVIHDKTVNRTTDGAGVVAEMTIDDLRTLDAGAWFSDSFADTAIPTLEEVLAHAASSGTDIVIEYKGTWTQADVRTTVDMIEVAGLNGRVIAQSFSAKTVANVSEVAPGLPVGWLTETINASIIDTALKIGADAVNPRHASVQSVALAHRAELGVFVWTHDADPDWETLTAIGVDGIITNRPQALHEWMLLRA